MTKLSDTQNQLLTQAAAGDSGAISAPADCKPAVEGLIKRGLFIALPQTDGPSRLLITDAGRAAVAVDQSAASEMSSQEGITQAGPPVTTGSAPSSAPLEICATKPPSKLQTLVDLLRRPGGAGVAEMMNATGWQAHSVRGALSGSLKKGMGLAVISQKTDEGRRYRIADDATMGAAA